MDRPIPVPVEDWYRIEAKADGDDKTKASLHIYDAIGGWVGIRVSQLVRDLAAITADEIDVYLNSPGGDAFGGLAIMNALRRHDATVTVHVDGLAASAASVIAMGGDVIEMGRGAQLMIHDASSIVWGPAADMEKEAEVLNKVSDSYAAAYAARAGGTATAWRKAMIRESWYTADEAVAAGLADRTIDTGDEADVEAAWNLTVYAYAGRSHAPVPFIPTMTSTAGPQISFTAARRTHSAVAVATALGSPQTSAAPAVDASPAAEPTDETHRKEPSMAFMEDIRQRLGTTADADEATILAALDEALAEQATDTPALPEGTALVDAEQLEQLQADAAAGRQAREEQVAARRASLVEAAVNDGRVPPSRRDHWVDYLAKDPAGEEALATLKPVANMTERGFTGGVDESSSEDAFFARLYSKEAPNA